MSGPYKGNLYLLLSFMLGPKVQPLSWINIFMNSYKYQPNKNH